MDRIKNFLKNYWPVCCLIPTAIILGVGYQINWILWGGLVLLTVFVVSFFVKALSNDPARTGQLIGLALVRWIIFGVLIGLLPIVAKAMSLNSDPSENLEFWSAIKVALKNGDLLIACTVFAAGIISDCVLHGKDTHNGEAGTDTKNHSLSEYLVNYTIIGVCLVIALVSSVWFMAVSGNDSKNNLSDSTFGGSLIMFGLVVGTGIFSAVYRGIKR